MDLGDFLILKIQMIGAKQNCSSSSYRTEDMKESEFFISLFITIFSCFSGVFKNTVNLLFSFELM